jgi:carbonic anhydrase
MSLATLLDRNKAFAGTDAVAKNPQIPFIPNQLSYVITCIDPRTEPAAFLGVDLGDAIVQRVVGGRVTPAVLRDVAYISYLLDTKAPDGPWFELAVIHHTDCGSTFLADPELRRDFAARTGFDEADLAWLAATDPAATVRTDVNTLVTAPQLSPNIRISGYVYNTAAGTVDTIVDPTPAGLTSRTH